ncbi:MAG: hypothetical protein ABW219_08510 [Ilumatobacteraceae bacterium]
MSRPWSVPLLVGVLAAGAACVGIDARATYGARVSGDEPQYLISATSIGEDLDLDVSDEIAARRFLPYHEIDLDVQTMPLDASGRQVSPHDPLLPVLLALPARLGGWWAAKATLALVAGLTAGVTTWLAMRRLSISPVAAGVGVGAAFVGIPLAAYGVQVYPEMPAALAAVVAVALLTAPTPSWRHRAGAVAAIVALPWLAVKYAPVAVVLAAGLLVSCRRRPRQVAGVVAAFVVAGALYLLAHRAWYGGWTVYATGDHFADTGEFSVVGTKVDLLGRSRRLIGLLVDQDFGVAAWSPVWLLAPFGLGLLAVRRWAGRWLVLAAIAAGWLNATFVALTMHGFWVPGRQIVVILPLAALGVALAADRGRAWLTATAVLGAVGAMNWVWLAVEASTGRRTLVYDFAATASWPYRAIRAVLPDGLRPTGASVALLLAWAAVVVTLFVAGIRASDAPRSLPQGARLRRTGARR